MADAPTDLAEPTELASSPKESASRSDTREFVTFLVKLFLIVFVIRSFIFAPFNIPSESMQPRLLIGDYLIVTKWNYGYSRYHLPFGAPIIDGRMLARDPARGDVVVFKAPPTARLDYIKRVIGLPGDIMAMQNGVLLLNGAPVPKTRIADLVIPVTPNMAAAAAAEGSPYPCFHPDFTESDRSGNVSCHYPRYRETLPGGRSYEILDLLPGQPGDNMAPVTVPAGHVFLMGDNRDRSSDSRFPARDGGAIGIVPMENLIGKAQVSVFSTDGSAEWMLPWTWFTAARWDRIGQGF